MNTSFRTHSILFALIAVIAVFIYSCGEDTVTPINNVPPVGTLSGTITFYDTNRVYDDSNYYDLSAYSSWPPAGPPSASSIINLSKTNNVYTGTYQLTGLPDSGSFYVVAAWIKFPYGPGSVYVSGMYNCDTNVVCMFTNPTPAILPGNQGLNNINFNADLDTANMQLRFP
jgi:hypothetical protein